MLRKLFAFKAASYQFGSVLASQDLGGPRRTGFCLSQGSPFPKYIVSFFHRCALVRGVVCDDDPFSGGETESGRGDTEAEPLVRLCSAG